MRHYFLEIVHFTALCTHTLFPQKKKEKTHSFFRGGVIVMGNKIEIKKNGEDCSLTDGPLVCL